MDPQLIDTIIGATATTRNVNNVLECAAVNFDLPHADFCLAFSKRVAKRYLDGELDFKTADMAMNWLFAYCYAMDNSAGEMPILAREIYDAFDSGEFFHPGDSASVDPEQKYTFPLLKEIVGRFNG